MPSLKGRIALVTGAGPNIGRTIAATLASAGATVICNDINVELANDAANAIKKAGGKAFAMAGDVSKPDIVSNLVGRAVDEVGIVDILVNNAGVTIPRSITSMTYEEWRKVMGVVLDGAFLMSQAVVKHLLAAKKPGAIVNMFSGETRSPPDMARKPAESRGFSRNENPKCLTETELTPNSGACPRIVSVRDFRE